ncbi:Mg2+ transporter-C (MgtC) family protein [Mycobacterium sp. MS1601]|uniref:MgtC/SapB family protein n=1 Tax=Mycobacterium sp. MS1601 TaxID=1936029 RepID=UPI0009792D16|nr:MgtC/SapB family protein [Mycobacterium sp. MS1601]AQA05052.1 Mg2+ transporter-C (MgtC) family protein [Mycobacterium sp. MS1601]
MQTLLAEAGFFDGPGQGSRQIIELLVAFTLTALIGLEREIQGKSAGLRTQAIVGTSAALILLVSKYGFHDVLAAGTVEVDPSRVAAQIVSGIGFLGAGLIITRRGAVHGLTTAAAVWESAAIGMAAGAGLLLLAVTVTVLHFVIVLGFAPVARRLNARLRGTIRLHLTYTDNAGVMRQVLQICDRHRWRLNELASDLPTDTPSSGAAQVGVTMALSGSGILQAPAVLAQISGVTALRQLDEQAE